MPWWGWIIFGALLLGSELAMIDAGFYLVFIGLAAMLTGLLEVFGLTLEPWMQWLVFAFISIILMVAFRKRLYDKIRKHQKGYEIGSENETIEIEQTLSAGEHGRVSFRGTSWNLVNIGDHTIEKGSRVSIDSIDGLTLKVKQSSSQSNPTQP